MLVRGSILHQKIQVGIAERDVTFNQDVKALQVKPEIMEPWYLLFWFMAKEPELLGMVEHTGIGAGKLDTEILQNLIVDVPPLEERNKILCFVKALDDRIELNRQMNETLEGMAQALFKSWFVDFDPVIDNALASGKEIPEELSERAEARAALGDKRKPLPEAIRILFPNEFTCSDEMGWIPKGWEIGLLRNIAENPRRGIQAKDIELGTPYIGLQDMPQKSVSLSVWGQADDVASSKFAFNRGEILFGKLRPYFHKVGIAPVDGVCSTDILVVLPKKREWYSIVFGHVTSVEFVEYTTIVSTGTKMPRTSWKDMGNYEVVIPSKQPAQFLSEQIKRNVDKILLNIEKMRTLSTLRDTLLPKLLSGEIRIPDAEKMAEGVA